MATKAYIGVSGGARALKNIYIGASNAARKVKRAYIGVGNSSRLWWKSSATLSTLRLTNLPTGTNSRYCTMLNYPCLNVNRSGNMILLRTAYGRYYNDSDSVDKMYMVNINNDLVTEVDLRPYYRRTNEGLIRSGVGAASFNGNSYLCFGSNYDYGSYTEIFVVNKDGVISKNDSINEYLGYKTGFYYCGVYKNTVRWYAYSGSGSQEDSVLTLRSNGTVTFLESGMISLRTLDAYAIVTVGDVGYVIDNNFACRDYITEAGVFSDTPDGFSDTMQTFWDGYNARDTIIVGIGRNATCYFDNLAVLHMFDDYDSPETLYGMMLIRDNFVLTPIDKGTDISCSYDGCQIEYNGEIIYYISDDLYIDEFKYNQSGVKSNYARYTAPQQVAGTDVVFNGITNDVAYFTYPQYNDLASTVAVRKIEY